MHLRIHRMVDLQPADLHINTGRQICIDPSLADPQRYVQLDFSGQMGVGVDLHRFQGFQLQGR